MSLLLSLGRLTVRCWTVSCWRGARFSKTRLVRLMNKPRNSRNSTLQMLMLANSCSLWYHFRWYLRESAIVRKPLWINKDGIFGRDRTFTKIPGSETEGVSARICFCVQALNQFSVSNDIYLAEVLKSRCVAHKVTWALHHTNDFLYLPFMFCVQLHKYNTYSYFTK